VGPRWWACGTGRQAHYYTQRHCRERLVHNPETYPLPSYHRQHGTDEHDCCPLMGCPRHGQRHGKRGTTLWQRAAFAEAEQPSAPSRSAFDLSVIEGMHEVVSALQGWKRVWVLSLAREDTQASTAAAHWQNVVEGGALLTADELFTLAENLFDREEGALSHAAALRQLAAHAHEIAKALDLSEALRFPQTTQEVVRFEIEELQPQAQEKILRALHQRGVDDAELLAWLRGETGLKIERTEENNHGAE